MIKTQDYFRELVTMIFMRISIIVAITIIFTVVAILIAFLAPPVYEASGAIIVKSNRPLTSPESVDDVPVELTVLEESNLFSEMQILRSTSLLNRTVQALKNNDEYFATKYESPKASRSLSSQLGANLTCEVVPQTNVIHVHFKWNDPGLAEQILKTHFMEYLSFRSEIYSPREAQVFFHDQLQNFNNELQKRENRLVELAREAGIAEPADQIKSNLLVLENLQKELIMLNSEYNERSRFVNYVKNSVGDNDLNFFTSVENLDIGDFGKKLQDLMLERNDMMRLYTETSPQIRKMDEQIAQANQALKGEVNRYIDSQIAQLEGLKESIAQVQEHMSYLEKRNVELYQAIVVNNRINREIELLEESYTTFGKRFEEARISAETETDRLFRVTILTEPQAGFTPVFPQKTKVIPLGFVLGLLVGCTIAFILEFFDHTFKRPEDVQTYTNLPSVYSISKR